MAKPTPSPRSRERTSTRKRGRPPMYEPGEVPQACPTCGEKRYDRTVSTRTREFKNIGTVIVYRVHRCPCGQHWTSRTPRALTTE